MNKSIFDIETKEEYEDLLSQGFTINLNEIKNESGFLSCALSNASREKRKWLVEKGADINFLNERQENFLWDSTFDDMEFWTEKGINVNNTDIDGNNILFYISYPQQVELFLSYGINVNQVNNKGENILFDLNNFNNNNIVYNMIKDKINIHQINKNNENILFTKPLRKASSFRAGI